MSPIKFIVYQSGYAVFGAGATRDTAIADAARWLEPDNGPQGSMTISEVEELIMSRPNNGEFGILTKDNDDFDSYLENQGGYSKINGQWFNSNGLSKILKCVKCSYEWIPRLIDRKPKCCPNCKSRTWEAKD